jgi:hypothetical protein
VSFLQISKPKQKGNVLNKINNNSLSNRNNKDTNTNNTLIHLQQTMGNQIVQRMIKSKEIQAKLRVSQPGDPYEREADRVAEQVMRMSLAGESNVPIKNSNNEKINRKCKSCEEEKSRENKVYRKTSSYNNKLGFSDNAKQDTNYDIHGKDSQLDIPTRTYMESQFGYDFTDVRIHTDEKADKFARSVNALAFTLGNDVFFGGGNYNPMTLEGKRLIAHELTHVLQQTRRSSITLPSALTNSTNDRIAPLEFPQLQRQAGSVSLEGWTGGWRDDSEMEIDVWANLFVEPISFFPANGRIFSKSKIEKMPFPLNAKGTLAMYGKVNLEADYFWAFGGNDKRTDNFDVEWTVSTDGQGNMTVAQGLPKYDQGNPDIPWVLNLTPFQDDKSKQMGIILRLSKSASKTEGGFNITGGYESKRGPSIGAGYETSRETQTSENSRIRSFAIQFDVTPPPQPIPPTPEPKVIIGKTVTAVWEREFEFEVQKGKLVNLDSNRDLTNFLLNFKGSEDGANITVRLTGSSSLLGEEKKKWGYEKNFQLSCDRAEFVKERVMKILPRAKVTTSCVGSGEQARSPDISNEKAQAVFIEINKDYETL